MYTHELGEISLNLSTIIYFVWFIPQLVLTFKRRNTDGLSLWMHALLATGYIADLMYGFGRHMPIQYRMVTIFGLFCLAIEHIQFGRYGLKKAIERKVYHSFNGLFILFFGFALYNIIDAHHNKNYYDFFGFVSSICWMTFFIPQIIKNYQAKKTQGLSTAFVWLSVLTGLCDVISAYTLGYDWPSLISAPVGLVKKSIVLSQCYYYKNLRKSIIVSDMP